jgi:hypothetical protein
MPAIPNRSKITASDVGSPGAEGRKNQKVLRSFPGIAGRANKSSIVEKSLNALSAVACARISNIEFAHN